MYEYRNIRGHIEVFVGGEFLFSADNYAEAEECVTEIESGKEA